MPRVAVHAFITVNAAHVEEFKTLFKEVMRASLAEPGCEYYVCTQDNQDPTKFHVFEIYKSPEAAEEHMKGAAVQKFGPFGARGDTLVGPPVIEKHELLEDVEKGIVA